MNINRKNSYLIFIMVLFYSTVSYAIGEESPSMGKVIFKFFFYMLIIFGVIIFTIYGTKFIAKSSKRFVSSRYIHILDRISLDTNTKIIIMEIGSFIYILAISNNIIETVDKIPIEDFHIKEELKFEEQLEWHKEKYKNINSSNFKTKIDKVSHKCNKFFNKEDEDNEEQY